MSSDTHNIERCADTIHGVHHYLGFILLGMSLTIGCAFGAAYLVKLAVGL